jgi:hypothetical protein
MVVKFWKPVPKFNHQSIFKFWFPVIVQPPKAQLPKALFKVSPTQFNTLPIHNKAHQTTLPIHSTRSQIQVQIAVAIHPIVSQIALNHPDIASQIQFIISHNQSHNQPQKPLSSSVSSVCTLLLIVGLTVTLTLLVFIVFHHQLPVFKLLLQLLEYIQ